MKNAKHRNDPEPEIVVEHGKCTICGQGGEFKAPKGFSLREAYCPGCRGSKRNRDLAKAILKTFIQGRVTSLKESLDSLRTLAIFEAQADGPIHRILRELPGYCCSEYFEGVAPGGANKAGIRCENLENLTLPRDRFDLVITQDVLEHVRNPEKAFLELNRVLKPGGFHIFTVPIHEGRRTVKRVEERDGKEVSLRPPVHHGDPLRGEGSLVCTDFGEDLIDNLKNLNLPTEIISREIFYTPDQIPLLEERKDYKRYLEWKARGKLLNFLLYNSIVFRTPKAKTGSKLAWTGERFVPWVEDPIIQYEHLHRYAYAKQFVSGKRVIDLACGEGYGSALLAETAASVIGLDIDELSIRHASQKYQRANLGFVQGSITAIPIQGRGIFDVAVCFEALEHIFEQTQLLKEVKRLLSTEGILLISTPNKKIYADDPVYRNPFHVKEMYFEEFREELSALFSNVFFFGQKIFPASNIFPLGENNGISQALAVEKKEEGFAFSPFSKKPARYFLALATDGKRIGEVAPGESYLVDLSETCRISPAKTRPPMVPAAGILEARYRKIQDLLLQGKEDQALRSLEEFVENFPQSGLAHNDLAVLALGKGEMEKALRHYEKAVALEPENITFKKNLGEFYFVVQQDKPKAEKILSEILEKNPDDGETLALLGEICIRSGSMAEGETYFRRAIEVDPENEKAHNFLQALSEKKVGRKEALPRPKQEGGVPPALKNADPESCNRMKEDWNKRAEEDPKYYIHSTARDQTEEEFDRSGKENVEDLILKDQTILSAAKPFSHMRTLEIGCGMGRMTKHLAEFFEEVHGIDVSGEMIRLARVRTAHLKNVFLYEGNGRGLEVFPNEFFDLAFSFIVFQHIPDKAVILNYIREAGRVLKTAGLFKFQVQGCTDPRWLRLPKDTWQGETVTEEEIRSISEEIGCEVISLEGQGTQYSFYTLRKRGGGKRIFKKNSLPVLRRGDVQS